VDADRRALGTGVREVTAPQVTVAVKCRAVKHGAVDLQCSLPADHDRPEDDKPGTWHESALTERREIDYDGAHHLIVITETVTWEPVDHAAEAARHLMAGRRRDRGISLPVVPPSDEEKPPAAPS
jgi:hypothetical protein